MDYDKLREAKINVDEGIKRFAGKQALYEKYLLKFLDDETFDMASKALETNSAEEGFRMVHTLKGAVGNLSIKSMYDLCSDYCTDYRAGKMELLDEDFKRIAAEYTHIVKVINESK